MLCGSASRNDFLELFCTDESKNALVANYLKFSNGARQWVYCILLKQHMIERQISLNHFMLGYILLDRHWIGKIKCVGPHLREGVPIQFVLQHIDTPL